MTEKERLERERRAAELAERTWRGRVRVAHEERASALVRVAELEETLRVVTKTLMDLAPYPPEVAEGVVAIVDIARESLAAPEAEPPEDEEEDTPS